MVKLDGEQIRNLENTENKSIDTQKLLLELSLDISNSFGIKAETAEKLTRLKTESGLDGLKAEIKSLDLSSEEKERLNSLGDKELERLFFTITGAKEVIKSASENKLDVLKKEIDKESFSHSKSWIEAKISDDLLHRINNPQNIGDNIIGTIIGIGNTGESFVKTAYRLGKGIIKAPYHIYLLVTGKAEIESLKKV